MSQLKEIAVIGVNFRTAELSVREALKFTPCEVESFCRELKNTMPDCEVLILSTCNRTEFYFAAPNIKSVISKTLSSLKKLRPNSPVLHAECLLYEYLGSKAAEHLFKVACGLDSAILGEIQILRQIKEALSHATQHRQLGAYLNHLFIQAVQLGKKARCETSISYGAASVGSVLAGRITRCFGEKDLQKLKILIVGAGEIASDVSQHIAKIGLGELCFINRTESKAIHLAKVLGGKSASWLALEQNLCDCDIAIFATSASQVILPKASLERVDSLRQQRPLILIDAGMPRNVEEGVMDIVNLDLIREEQKDVEMLRKSAVGDVLSMVEENLYSWKNWVEAQKVEILIASLYKEISSQMNSSLDELSEVVHKDPAEVKMLLSRFLNRALHSHVKRLRDLGCVKK